jgi:hypothetical protein
MTDVSKLGLACALALALAACGERKADEGGNAVSEVLPGSASDAMIPYDTLRSQPPLAPDAQAEGSGAPRDRSPLQDDASVAAEAGAEVSTGATEPSGAASAAPGSVPSNPPAEAP